MRCSARSDAADGALLGLPHAPRSLHVDLPQSWAARTHLRLRARPLRRAAGGSMERPHRLRSSRGDGGFSRSSRPPGLCLRRAGDGRCGAPDFTAHCRLPAEEFFADAFITEAELAAARRRRAEETRNGKRHRNPQPGLRAREQVIGRQGRDALARHDGSATASPNRAASTRSSWASNACARASPRSSSAAA